MSFVQPLPHKRCEAGLTNGINASTLFRAELCQIKSGFLSPDYWCNAIRNIHLYQQSGRIPPDSDTYKQIETLTIQKYFPTFYYSYKQNLQTIQTLSEQLQKANMDKENLQSENEQLKAEIASIKEQIENRESRG